VLGRALRWTGEQLAFLLVLGVLAAGFAYLVFDASQWRPAALLVAVAVLVAGALRAVLPTRRVGLLAVRARWIDTVLYLALGGVILALDLRLHA
jgi:hypothetical protein